MEHIAALLLIVGCSGDLKTCDELPSPVTIFETAADCDAQLPATLRELGSKRPKVLATCVPVDPAMEEEDAELVWDIAPDGTLRASVERANMNVAAIAGHTRHE